MSPCSYPDLVAQRKQCQECPGLTNPAIVDDGRLDSDRIGPYSLWQGNIKTPLIVVGQDFADVENFQRHQGWPGERVGTNLALVELAAEAGFTIQPPKRGCSDDTLFFTNAILCLKQGGMQARVDRNHARTCGERFLRPLIELVAPRAVVTLGTAALDATLGAHGLRRRGGLVRLIEAGTVWDLASGPRLFPLCHPSRTVLNTTRSLPQQKADWRRVGAWLRDRQHDAA